MQVNRDSNLFHIKTTPDRDGMYKCDGCNHKPFKRYGSYRNHARKCLQKLQERQLESERLNRFLDTESNESNTSSSSKKRKVKLTIARSRKLIAENKQLIIKTETQARDARADIRSRLKKAEEELDILRNEKSSLEQRVKLMTAKFDTLNCKNVELLQMIENFSIEFLKTREYEF